MTSKTSPRTPIGRATIWTSTGQMTNMIVAFVVLPSKGVNDRFTAQVAEGDDSTQDERSEVTVRGGFQIASRGRAIDRATVEMVLQLEAVLEAQFAHVAVEVVTRPPELGSSFVPQSFHVVLEIAERGSMHIT